MRAVSAVRPVEHEPTASLAAACGVSGTRSLLLPSVNVNGKEEKTARALCSVGPGEL